MGGRAVVSNEDRALAPPWPSKVGRDPTVPTTSFSRASVTGHPVRWPRNLAGSKRVDCHQSIGPTTEMPQYSKLSHNRTIFCHPDVTASQYLRAA